jgi:hypothetical protein
MYIFVELEKGGMWGIRQALGVVLKRKKNELRSQLVFS